MDIIMIRHGESEDNTLKVFSRDTTGLTEKGIEDIKNAKRILKDYKFNSVYYSPLTRTKETLDYLGLDGVEEERIREINFGIFTGHSFLEFNDLYPKEAKAWVDDPYNYHVPDGENINAVYTRVKDFLDEVSKLNENIVIVTHEGIIRLACCWALDDPNLFFKFKADNGSINIISVNEDYKYISKLNHK